MRGRRAALAAGAAVLAFASNGCGAGEGTSTNSTTLTVYSSLPLQGPGAERSQQIVDGEKLALKQSEGMVGDFTINFRSLDDSTAEGGWNADATITAARAVTQDRSTIALIGDADAGATALSLPVTNAAGVMQVTPAASYAGFSGDEGAGEGEPAKYLPSGTSSFARLVPPDPVQAALIASTLAARGCKKLVVVVTRVGFDISLARLVARAADRAGVPLAEQVQIPHDAATNAKARDEMAADVVKEGAGCTVVSAGVNEHPAGLFTALHRADPSMILVAPLALSDGSLARSLGSASDRTIIVGPDARGMRATPFLSAFRRAYGRDPGPWAAYGYEAMKLVLYSVSKAGEEGNDRRAVSVALRAAHDRPSALGIYSIKPSGDSTLRGLSLYRVSGGELKPS